MLAVTLLRIVASVTTNVHLIGERYFLYRIFFTALPTSQEHPLLDGAGETMNHFFYNIQ